MGIFFQEYDATMDAPHQAGAAGHDAEAPRVPASDRLQLEIALLAAEPSPTADDTERAGDGGSAILLAVSDPDIRDYIRQCLRAQAELRIVESRSGDDPFDVARRLSARLLITDLPIVATDATRARGIPVLLTGAELPDHLPAGEGMRMTFLLQPFNAHRLLEAVQRASPPAP